MTTHATTRTSSRTSSPLLEICRSPAGQGVLTGVSGLVPVRRYPRWLRGTLVWAPTLLVAAAGFAPERVQQAARAAGVDLDQETGDSADEPAGDPIEDGGDEGSGEGAAPLPARLGLGLLCGAATYGVMRISLWSDTALESALRKARVPAPRLVMAAAGGVAAWGLAERERRQAGAA
ncbi:MULTISPECIES: hypothetical protein [Actinomycetes]|uniref:hypothetical protein n=1 Tax=Actinomycetes TaxID=1760 RepID=UPI0031D3D0A2